MEYAETFYACRGDLWLLSFGKLAIIMPVLHSCT